MSPKREIVQDFSSMLTMMRRMTVSSPMTYSRINTGLIFPQNLTKNLDPWLVFSEF
ncbi:hypothetical protein C8R48DRAFT_743625, partial [Suillus tomentosus]